MENKENWVNTKWRPMCGWSYITICLFDFIAGPILYNLLQVMTKVEISLWQPLTLQGSGLFHLSFGAILGVAVYGRTQEKITNNPTPYNENISESSSKVRINPRVPVRHNG